MKSLTFNKDSWHFRFVTTFTSWNRHFTHDSDICEYTRQFLKALFICACCCFAGGLVIYSAVDAVMAILFLIFTGNWLIGPFGFMFLLISSALIIATAILWGIECIKDYRYNKRRENEDKEPKPDGFIKNAWKSHVGKYCVKIDFVDEKEKDIA